MSSLTSGKPVDPDALRKEISDLVKGTTSAAGAIKGGMPVYTSPVYATPSGRPPVVPTGSPLGLPAGSSTTG
ncbi:hypothetical protein ABTK02_20300, partial [Acinetobacter baumannii]